MFYSLYRQQSQTQNAASATAEAQDRVFTHWPVTYQDGFETIDPNQWQLEITGLVEQPRHYSLSDLSALTRIQQNRRLVFADGWSYRATWEGFVFSELLHRINPKPEARYLHQVNLAGQVECMPISDLTAGRALMCMRAEGHPLPPLYGGPLRLLVFDRYAHKGLSQLVRLEFSDQPVAGYWAGKGYDLDARIEPGTYYAADLQSMQTIREPGEVTQW